MKSRTRPRLAARLLCALAALAAVPAFAVCRIEPFSDDAVTARAEAVRQICAGPQFKWGLEVPKNNVLRTRFDGLLSERISPTVESGLRLTWSAQHNQEAGGSNTEQALLASAWRWRPAQELTVNLRIGRELFGAFRERMTLSGLWQPTRQALMFAEWAGNPAGTELHQFGMRLWLIGQRVALEAGIGHRPDGVGWTDQRVRLTVDLRP